MLSLVLLENIVHVILLMICETYSIYEYRSYDCYDCYDCYNLYYTLVAPASKYYILNY